MNSMHQNFNSHIVNNADELCFARLTSHVRSAAHTRLPFFFRKENKLGSTSKMRAKQGISSILLNFAFYVHAYFFLCFLFVHAESERMASVLKINRSTWFPLRTDNTCFSPSVRRFNGHCTQIAIT